MVRLPAGIARIVSVLQSAARIAGHAHARLDHDQGKVTSRTAILSWSDSQVGCIAEQIWTLGRARPGDVCAITGEPIARGDPVFRPRKARIAALNARSVIAAHHVLETPISV